jgi:hypothetical protein
MTKNVLDLEMLEKSHNQYTKTKKEQIPVNIEGKEQLATLELDVIFKPSKIRSCIEEYVEKMDAVTKMNRRHLHEVMEAYLIFMIIKHFTSFPIPNKYEDQVKVLQMMIETGLLYRIYAKFDQNELAKIHEEVSFVAEKLDESTDMVIEMSERMGFDTNTNTY